MSNKNNEFDEYEIFLAYLNDAEDRELTDKVLLSQKACEQLSQLQEDMNSIDNVLQQHQVDDGYGATLWNSIADQLDEKPRQSLWWRLVNVWQLPGFSAVGLSLMLVMAINFYLLGRNHGASEIQPHNPGYEQMLAQNINVYLGQTDVFLTQVSNIQNAQDNDLLAKSAQNLLVSNRLYKNALNQSGDKQLKSLLSELEKVLIEVSNGYSPLEKQYLKNYTKDQLLFKVKSTRNQLASKSQSTMSI